jgi:hypothetical protein
MPKLARSKDYKARLELLSNPAHIVVLTDEERARLRAFNEGLEEAIHALIRQVRADFAMSGRNLEVEIDGIDSESRMASIKITSPIYYGSACYEMQVTRSFALIVPQLRDGLERRFETLRDEIISFHKSLYAFQKAQQLVESTPNLGPLPEHRHKS